MKPTAKEAPTTNFLLESFLPYRLSLLSNTVSEGIAGQYRAEFGFSVMEWRVLAILGRFSGLTASDVMERGAMDKVAVSRAVGRLEEKGLITRAPEPQDRRRMTLNLTAQGLEAFQKVVPRAQAYERALLASLTVWEQETLDQLLQQLQERALALK